MSLMRTSKATSAQIARYTKAVVGETALQRTPAMALATILPKLCTAESKPNADPRRFVGARVATAAC